MVKRLEREDPAKLFFRSGAARIDAEVIQAANEYAPAFADLHTTFWPNVRHRNGWVPWSRPRVKQEPNGSKARPSHVVPDIDQRSAEVWDHPWPRMVFIDTGHRVPPHPGADEQAQIPRPRQSIG